jgi:hypothetical protein
LFGISSELILGIVAITLSGISSNILWLASVTASNGMWLASVFDCSSVATVVAWSYLASLAVSVLVPAIPLGGYLYNKQCA